MEQTLRQLIEAAINRTSSENGSDTPDFILAEYLTDCLSAFDKAVILRENFYQRMCGGGTGINQKAHESGTAKYIREIQAANPVKEFYIYSRKHSKMGDATWWREDGKGYTTDITQAGKYRGDEAESISTKSHGESVAIHYSLVERLPKYKTATIDSVEMAIAEAAE